MSSAMALRLDEKTREKLGRLAARRGTTRSALVREAIDDLDRPGGRRGVAASLGPRSGPHRLRPGRRSGSSHRRWAKGRPGAQREAGHPVILVDAGPLVALIDADDRHHDACVEALTAIREPLGTVWPAITEAMYLLADVPKGQAGVWQLVERGAVRLLPLGDEDIPTDAAVDGELRRPPDGSRRCRARPRRGTGRGSDRLHARPARLRRLSPPGRTAPDLSPEVPRVDSRGSTARVRRRW